MIYFDATLSKYKRPTTLEVFASTQKKEIEDEKIDFSAHYVNDVSAEEFKHIEL